MSAPHTPPAGADPASGIELQARTRWPGFEMNVALTLPGRGVTALFGPSGSGKTTLLRCLAGLERPPLGRVVFQGEVWQDERTWVPTHQRPIGYVFQEASLFPHLSVMGNLQFGVKRSATAGRVSLDQAVALLGIEALLDRKPERLSGGERQRVGIARALAVGPRLLLMDEPLAALDLKRKQEILPYLQRLHDELDIPIVYVSHAPDEVMRLADHLVALEQGRVVVEGPLLDTLSRLDLPLRLGEEVGVVLDAVVGERDAQWQLSRLDFDGGALWLRDPGLDVGARVRARVLARDVSLALSRSTDCSIQNHWPAVVEALGDDEAHPGLTLVRVRVTRPDGSAGAAIVSRMMRRSAHVLGLSSGMTVWAQVKSAALMG